MKGSCTNSSMDCRVQRTTGFMIDIYNMASTDNRNVHKYYIFGRRGLEYSILLKFFFQNCLHQAKTFLLLCFMGFPTIAKAADVIYAGRNYSTNGSEGISITANCNIMHRSEAYVQDGYMNLYNFLLVILFVFFGIGILLIPFFRPRSYHRRNDGTQFDQEEDLADDDTSAINLDYTSNWELQCPTAVDCVSLNISQRNCLFSPDHQQPLSSVAVYHHIANKLTLLEHVVEIPKDLVESGRFPTTTSPMEIVWIYIHTQQFIFESNKSKILSGIYQGAALRPILSKVDAFSCILTNEKESLCMSVKNKPAYMLNGDEETCCCAQVIEQVADIEDTDVINSYIETSVCLGSNNLSAKGSNNLSAFVCNVGIQSFSLDMRHQECVFPLQPWKEISNPESITTNNISSSSCHPDGYVDCCFDSCIKPFQCLCE